MMEKVMDIPEVIEMFNEANTILGYDLKEVFELPWRSFVSLTSD
jgi:hypothetical protein